MNQQSKNNSRRKFIKDAALATAGTVGFLNSDWNTASAKKVEKKERGKQPTHPGPIFQLPLQDFGFTDIPAIPFVIEGIAEELGLLGIRAFEAQQSKNGLNQNFTINGQTAPAFSFLYGRGASSAITQKQQDEFIKILETTSIEALLDPGFVRNLITEFGRNTFTLNQDPITALSLDQPQQFSLSWTTFYNFFSRASAGFLQFWSSSLTDVTAATNQFWPTISKFGLAYNLLLLQKVSSERLSEFRQKLGDLLNSSYNLDQLAAAGNLFAIDLTIFHGLDVEQVDGAPRFTPASFTLLQQDPVSKDLTPFTIIISGENGANSQTYVKGVSANGAWLYALQAAKISITVYGIWIGHVYHYHIVTASMVMTMYNNLSESHPLYPMLDLPSRHVIEFNEILLFLWGTIAPPSSLTNGLQLIQLLNTFSKGRNFFDDDPLDELNNHGIVQSDFTDGTGQPWNKFPIAGYLLQIYQDTNNYVTSVVNNLYASDADVVADTSLQAWMNRASDPDGGNIRGLPTMNSRAALISVLTSYLNRIAAHGSSRLIESANPSLTFVANFPPCLQKTDIPSSSTNLTTQQLLQYLPATGTIGEMINFYYIFSFSSPYDSLIPVQGADTNFYFSGNSGDPKNQALIQFRNQISSFINTFMVATQIPGFAPDEGQYAQWSANVET